MNELRFGQGLRKLLTARRFWIVAGVIAAALVFWGASRRVDSSIAAVPSSAEQPVSSPQPSAAGQAASSASQAPTAAPAERATVRLYRDPLAVAPFTVKDIEGRTHNSADWRGKVVLVNFWATWCGPCRTEIPQLIEMQEHYRDHLVVLGVSVDQAPVEAVKSFATELGINYPIVMVTAELEKLFPRPEAIPSLFVLDRESRLVQRHIGLNSAVMTEMEVRAAAGLSVNANIERVERFTGIQLDDTAQLTSVPGVDLASLTPERRAQALQKLNSVACTCGCDLTVAKCRIDDPSCATSLPIAKDIVDKARAGSPAR